MGEEEGEEEEEHLLRTFEEIQYLIEDLDNANSMTSSTTLCIYHLVKLLFQLKHVRDEVRKYCLFFFYCRPDTNERC